MPLSYHHIVPGMEALLPGLCSDSLYYCAAVAASHSTVGKYTALLYAGGADAISLHVTESALIARILDIEMAVMISVARRLRAPPAASLH